MTPPEADNAACKSTQHALLAVIVLVVGLLSFRIYNDTAGPRPVEIQRPEKFDLNRASRADLLQIPGIGSERIDGILAYRQLHGRFSNTDELRRVEGIGPVTAQRLQNHFYVREIVPEDEPLRLQRKEVATSSLKRSERLVDLNRALQADIEKLPGIGRTLAERIVSEREARPFKKVDDLRRVPGIGVKRLEQLRPLVEIRPPDPEDGTMR